MKKSMIALFFALITVFAFEAKSQCTPISLAEPGLSPSDDSLDCIIQGVETNTTIYFKNFTMVGPVTVEWLRIDSLQHLPTGLTYCINDPDFTFETGDSGCIQVTGTTNDVVGQYKLGIYVTVKVSAAPNPLSGEAGQLSATLGGPDFSYYVRVKADSSAACTAIDTTGATTNQAGETKTSAPCEVGIEEIRNVTSFSINPNPVKSTADVKFSLEKPMDVKVVVYSSVGQKVYQSDLKGAAGDNRVSIDRGNLQAGLYLISLEQGGQSLMSKQVVME